MTHNVVPEMTGTGTLNATIPYQPGPFCLLNCLLLIQHNSSSDRRVQIEILFVGKEHLLHLINGQTSQKSSASFQSFKYNSIAENLRWHAPKS